MPEERQGFFGRWARRKSELAQGRPLTKPETEKPAPAVAVSPDAMKDIADGAMPASAEERKSLEKTLSLDDVALLTRKSDFKPLGRLYA